MKKIISIDLQVLQELNTPYRLNIDRLTELKSYIEDPDYQVFIYITKPLKNRAAYFRQLKNNEIIDNTLGRQAKIIDFYKKKERLTAQLHVQSLEKKADQISAFIAIGLPQDQRFIWLQKMDASIVEWDSLSELSLETTLNEQLSVGNLSPEDEAIYSYEKQPRELPNNVAYEHHLPRYKRALTVTTMPPSADFYKMIVEQHAQTMDKFNFLQNLIEQENPFPGLISLEWFHSIHLVFDIIHFIVELISIWVVRQHIKHSASNNAHQSLSSGGAGNTVIPISLDMRMESEKDETNPFKEKEMNSSDMNVYQRTFRNEPRRSKMVMSAKLGEFPTSESKMAEKKEQETQEKQEKLASSSKCGGFFSCLPCCRKEINPPISEYTKPMQAESPVKGSEKLAFSDSSTQTRPAKVPSTQASSALSSRSNSDEQIDSATTQIDLPKTSAGSTSFQPEQGKSIAEGQKLSSIQVQKTLNKAKKKSSTFPKRSSQHSDTQEMKETTPLKSTSCSSLPKINYHSTTGSYFNLNQEAMNQQTMATEEGSEVVLMKSSAC